MPRYKLLLGSHSYGGIVYPKGDEIEVSKEHAERFGGEQRFRLLMDSKSDSKPTEDEITITDLLAKSMPEIKAHIAVVSDVGTLDDVQAEEQKGKQRADVLKAIEARRKALKG